VFFLYNVILTNDAKKALKKLSKQYQVRILSVIERIRLRPHSYVKSIIGSPYFRLRVGKYRVILDVKSGILLIIVIDIGHRRNVYK
jgi:mRNA interferase RelE/StbE